MIEPIQQRGGNSKAKVVCDDCGADEVVACAYSRTSPNLPRQPNRAQARAKVIAAGWSYSKKMLRCKECTQKRKVVQMPTKPAPAKPIAAKPTQPTGLQKRAIIAALEDYYDDDAGRYKSGETDQTIADLCEVMPGFVAQIREDLFGPDGGNESIENLTERFEALAAQIVEAAKVAETLTATIKGLRADNESLQDDLAKIKKAVGPAARAKAGV